MFRNVFIIIMVSLVLSTSFYFYDTVYMDGKQKDLIETQLQGVENLFLEIERVEDSYEGLEERFGEKLKEFDDLKMNIPDRNDFITIFDQIRRLADRHKIEITSLNPILDDSFPAIKENLQLTKKHIERLPIQVKCAGKYVNMGKFIEDVTDLRYKVNVGRYTISTDTDYGGQVTCDLVFFAYRFIEN